MSWVQEIRDLAAGPVEEAAALAPLTTLRVGGKAEALLRLEDTRILGAVLDTARRRGVPVRFLGNGSNVLVGDGGVGGLVVLMTGLRSVEVAGERLVAGCGVNLITLVQAGLKAGLTGMEWASGIPGTVGGAAVMNAGAHGGETKDRLEAALVVEDGTGPHWREARDLRYGYRSSSLKAGGVAVLAGRFHLVPGDVGEGRERMREFLAHRKRTQPTGNNAGSMFQNPEGDFAGRLIQEAGAKGLGIGGAQVSKLHGNFFLNTGGASAEDVMALVETVRGRVQGATGTALALEVEVWDR